LGVNAELCRQIADIIETTPAEFHMCGWVQKSECGTTMCIAGWALRLTGGNICEDANGPYFWDAQGEMSDKDIVEDAARALGLPLGSADRLFHGGHVLNGFTDEPYDNAWPGWLNADASDHTNARILLLGLADGTVDPVTLDRREASQ
jgi:hypothetical protein